MNECIRSIQNNTHTPNRTTFRYKVGYVVNTHTKLLKWIWNRNVWARQAAKKEKDRKQPRQRMRNNNKKRSEQCGNGVNDFLFHFSANITCFPLATKSRFMVLGKERIIPYIIYAVICWFCYEILLAVSLAVAIALTLLNKCEQTINGSAGVPMASTLNQII